MNAKCVLILVFLVGSIQWSMATLSNATYVVDSAGGWSSGGTYSNLSVIAQSGGMVISASNSVVNYSGFLNTFVLNTELDTDNDGIADELDPDNDDDGLADIDELAGSAFDPATVTDLNLSDTDGDGMSDLVEASSGTDPLDASVLLHFTSVESSGDDLVLGWQARSNWTYRIRASDSIIDDGDFTNIVVSSVLVTNSASPPWYVTTNFYRQVGASANHAKRFYIIEANK
jgi:hypothetical protein